jgi:hypothetical protein
MIQGLPPHFINLVQDALLKSFWTKRALRNFLRRSHIADSFLAQLPPEETKRDWLDRLFTKLEGAEKGGAVIREMARSLANQTTFPDLVNWEDCAEKTLAAKAAVAALKSYLAKKDEEQESEKQVASRRKSGEEQRQKALRSQADLTKLKGRLDDLCAQLGTQQGGYGFQEWFYDLMDYFDIDNRRPYVAAGRQIDGSVTIDGTTYLIESKFTGGQSDATDIDSLVKKVTSKADNTMGIMVVMAGFSTVAIREASFAKSPLLLLDHSHLYMVLSGIETFPNVIRRIRRHSSQEGEAYLPVTRFGGSE